MIVDGQKVEKPSSIDYSFKDIDKHEIYILINMEQYGNSLDNLFSDVNRMISISFTSLFKTSNIVNMIQFFYQCSKLELINNIYNLDIGKVKDIGFFFIIVLN